MVDVSIARRLAGALEPIAGQAQFSPECHRNYVALGFPSSPGQVGLTALPDKCGFFTARGSVLGDVPAELVAAAFAVFNPEEIVPLVRRGQALADAATVWAARLDGAAAQLRRILGPAPDRVGWVSDRRSDCSATCSGGWPHAPTRPGGAGPRISWTPARLDSAPAGSSTARLG